jgi:hypothetical protein
MSGIVVSLHIAPEVHAPMIFLPVAHLVPGKGIEGDRYYTHPKRPQPGAKTPYNSPRNLDREAACDIPG